MTVRPRPRLLRTRDAAATAVVAGLLLSPVVLGLVAVARLDNTPRELAPEPVPVLGVVTERIDDTPIPARITSADLAGHDLTAPPGLSGLVTSVEVAPGAPLGDLDTIAIIDGAVLAAVDSAGPFYRDLARGSVGDDVTMLQELLIRAGLRSAPATGRFDAATGREVAALNRQWGRAGSGSTFGAGSVVWLPTTGAIVSQIPITVGRPVTPPGSTILTVTSTTGGQISATDGRDLSFDQPMVLRHEGRNVATVRSARVDPAVLIALVLATAEAAEGDRDEGRGRTSAEVNIAVELVPVAASTDMIVPVGAVVTITGTEQQCLFVTDDGRSFAPFPTTVTGGDFGYLAIDPAPVVGTQVLTNPLDVLAEPISCDR